MFTTPKKVASRFPQAGHPYHSSPFKYFRDRGSSTVSPSSSPARQARSPVNPLYSPLISKTPTPRKRYRPAGDPLSPSPRVGRSTPNRKGPHRVGGRGFVQAQNSLRKERSFRSLERDYHHPASSPTGYGNGSGSDTSNDSFEFTSLAENVLRTFASPRVPMTEQERVFNEQFKKLGVNYVIATGFVDPQRAEVAAPVLSKSHLERILLEKELEMQRKRHDSAIREAEQKAHREAKERRESLAQAERDLKERQSRQEQEEKDLEADLAERQRKLEEMRRVHEQRERERAEARRREVRRREEEEAVLREEHIRTAKEHQSQLESERQARILAQQAVEEMERNAELRRDLQEEALRAAAEADLRAQEQARARYYAEEEARRAKERLQAQAEELIRAQKAQESLDAQIRAENEARWREQEARFRLHAEEYVQAEARLQAEAAAAQAQAQWEQYHYAQQQHEYEQAQYYQQQQYQYQQQQQQFYTDPDVHMREPSIRVDIMDASMASIAPETETPAPAPPRSPTPDPEPYIPPPTPQTHEEWFALYDAKWVAIRQSDAIAAPNLTFAHFPWPVFRFVESLDDLTEDDIKDFFKWKYAHTTGKLVGKTWRDDLRRWHTDKFSQFTGKIVPQEVGEVSEGFSRCIKVMTVFQREKEEMRY